MAECSMSMAISPVLHCPYRGAKPCPHNIYPDDDLPKDFDLQRDAYYAALKQPQDVDLFIVDLQRRLRQALQTRDQGLPTNPKVKILTNGEGWIQLTPLDPQPEPPLSRQSQRRSRTALADDQLAGHPQRS